MSEDGQRAQRRERRTGIDNNGHEYVDHIVEPGVEDSLPTPVRNLLSKDFPLSNIDRADREYIRLLAENIVLYSREMYPPKESEIQGDRGAALLEDPDYNRHALSERKLNEIESTLIASFARSSRGMGGWQQDKFSESIQTQRLEKDEQEDSGGLMGGIF
jgi:hypothetical protein